jgi:hypothetical protein
VKGVPVRGSSGTFGAGGNRPAISFSIDSKKSQYPGVFGVSRNKIDVLISWTTVPGTRPYGQKNAQNEYTVITIITRFYVHQDK